MIRLYHVSVSSESLFVCLFVCAATGQPGGVHQSVHHEVVLPVLPGQSEWSHSKRPPARHTVCHVYGLAMSPPQVTKNPPPYWIHVLWSKTGNELHSICNKWWGQIYKCYKCLVLCLSLPNLARPKRPKSINVAFTVTETWLQSEPDEKTN